MDIAFKNSYLESIPLRTEIKSAKRIFEIDLLRGILILLMVVDHLAYDFGILAPSFFAMADAPQALRDLSEWCFDYWFEAWRINIRYGVIALFFLLSGISTFLSRNSLKRGIIVFGFGAIVSSFSYLASILFKTDLFIYFGIISCFGLSIIIYSLFRLFILKSTGSLLMWKSVSLFLALLFLGVGYWMRVEVATQTINAQNWWYLINGRLTAAVPTYRIIRGIFTPLKYDFQTKVNIVLGRTWYGVDWGGLFPYLGYMFLGGFLGEMLYAHKTSLIFKKTNAFSKGVERVFKPLTFIGSKTIYIYLFHQIVLALITSIIFMLLGVPIK